MKRSRLSPARIALTSLPLIAAFALVACDEDPVLIGVPGGGDETGPLPLACANDTAASASGVIDASGGTLVLKGHTVLFPPGALNDPVELSVTAPVSEILRLDIEAVEFPGFTLATPLLATISYAHCPGAALITSLFRVWRLDPASGGLLEELGGLDDKEAQTVSFIATRLGTFVVTD